MIISDHIGVAVLLTIVVESGGVPVELLTGLDRLVLRRELGVVVRLQLLHMQEQAVHVDRRMLLHGHCLVLDTPQLNRVVVADGERTSVLLASGEGACEGGLHVVVVGLHEHHELVVGGGGAVVVVGVGLVEELVGEVDGGVEGVVGREAKGCQKIQQSL